MSKHTPEYRAWYHMKTRCYNANYKLFSRYGGRGITVCDRWLNSFENFFNDIGERPSREHSLDRFPNMDGNYEPSNCRWATTFEQQNNKCNNRFVTEDGITLTVSEWARRVGTTSTIIHRRLKRGDRVSDDGKRKIVIDLGTGIFYNSSKEAAIAKNINISTLRAMLKNRVYNKSNMAYI
jgi:hypothetical protein